MAVARPRAPRAAADRAAARSKAAWFSLGVGSAVFLAKVLAAWITGSSAVLSDALESIVNLVAAAFAIRAVKLASEPPDRDHPYGHGKIEFVASAFEGGLITFAALLIALNAAQALIVGPRLRSLDAGLAVVAGAAAVNFALAKWLVHSGRSLGSPTLEADGTHILSDVWTTVGVIGGLGLVRLTGIVLLDPLTALVVAGILARTGAKLVRAAVSALVDREDEPLLARVVAAFNQAHVPGIDGLHQLRALRWGDTIHVDAHVFVPRHWSVAQAHEAVRQLAAELAERTGLEGEFALSPEPSRTITPRIHPFDPCPLGADPIDADPGSPPNDGAGAEPTAPARPT